MAGVVTKNTTTKGYTSYLRSVSVVHFRFAPLLLSHSSSFHVASYVPVVDHHDLIAVFLCPSGMGCLVRVWLVVCTLLFCTPLSLPPCPTTIITVSRISVSLSNSAYISRTARCAYLWALVPWSAPALLPHPIAVQLRIHRDLAPTSLSPPVPTCTLRCLPPLLPTHSR